MGSISTPTKRAAPLVDLTKEDTGESPFKKPRPSELIAPGRVPRRSRKLIAQFTILDSSDDEETIGQGGNPSPIKQCFETLVEPEVEVAEAALVAGADIEQSSSQAQAMARKSAPAANLNLEISTGLPATQPADSLAHTPVSSPAKKCRIGLFDHIASFGRAFRSPPKPKQAASVLAPAQGPSSAKNSADASLAPPEGCASPRGKEAAVGSIDRFAWFKGLGSPGKVKAALSGSPDADSPGGATTQVTPNLAAADAHTARLDTAEGSAPGAQDGPAVLPAAVSAVIKQEPAAGRSAAAAAAPAAPAPAAAAATVVKKEGTGGVLTAAEHMRKAGAAQVKTEPAAAPEPFGTTVTIGRLAAVNTEEDDEAVSPETAAGAAVGAAGELPPRRRTQAKRLDPRWDSKRYSLASVVPGDGGGARHAQASRKKQMGKLGGKIPDMLRSTKAGSNNAPAPKAWRQAARPENALASVARAAQSPSADVSEDEDIAAAPGWGLQRSMLRRNKRRGPLRSARAEAVELSAEEMADAVAEPEEEMAAAAEAPPTAAELEAAAAMQVPIQVVKTDADLDADDELVHEVYTEDVYQKLLCALSDPERDPRRNVHVTRFTQRNFWGLGSKGSTYRKVIAAIKEYLPKTVEQRRAYMHEHTEIFMLTDDNHPAKKRQADMLCHLNIRKEELGLRAKKSLEPHTLIGEYVGTVKTSEAADADATGDRFGCSGLRNDKLKEFDHSGKEAKALARGLWTAGLDLVVDPAKAGNLLRFINDYQGMPDGTKANVKAVEVMDFATLRPHMFLFTTIAVEAGQEILLDYGDQYRRFMDEELLRAKSLVEARKEAAAAEAETAQLTQLVERLSREKVAAAAENNGLRTRLAELSSMLEDANQRIEALQGMLAANGIPI